MNAITKLRQAVVSARGLHKTHAARAAAVHALRGVDLDIHRGLVTVLRGPSGSGKTTLLSVIGCILRPDSGSLRINGRDMLGLSQAALSDLRRTEIGFVFQSYNLFPSITAWQNVALALDLRAVPRPRLRPLALAALAKVGLADKAESFPHELSGGQQQRVAIARAIVGSPSILLADEPTAALDSHNGRHVVELLCRLAHEDGKAVVIVTHDERIMEFADRIISMEDGKVIPSPFDPSRPGLPEELLAIEARDPPEALETLAAASPASAAAASADGYSAVSGQPSGRGWMRRLGSLAVFALSLLIGLTVASDLPVSRSRAELPKAAPSISEAPAQADPAPRVIAAVGKVEPASSEVVLAADIDGRLEKLLVKEGDSVRAGEVVAELDHGVYQARIDEATALIHQREAELLRLKNGARIEERREAEAAVQEAEAVARNTAIELARRETLNKQGFTSLEELQRIVRQDAVARAQLEQARERYQLVMGAPRVEDVAKATAAVELADAQLQEARAMMDKTYIRSPISGTVLHKYHNPGEVLVAMRDSNIVSVGDLSKLQVWAEVDEADIAGLAPGERAYVKARAFGEKRFSGRVVEIGRKVGEKGVYTGEPGERVDTKVVRVKIVLDAPQGLVPGMTVDAFLAPRSTGESLAEAQPRD